MSTHYSKLLSQTLDFIEQEYRSDQLCLHYRRLPPLVMQNKSAPQRANESDSTLLKPSFTLESANIPPESKPVKSKELRPEPHPPQEEKKKHTAPKKGIELQPLQSTPSAQSFDVNIASILQKIAPSVEIHRELISDNKAQRVKNAWRTKKEIPAIPILYSKGLSAFRPLLLNIAAAIDTQIAPSRLVDIDTFDQSESWQTLIEYEKVQFVIAPDHLLLESAGLKRHLRENPATQERFLGEIPLLLLFNLSMYYKAPQLKKSLWKLIRQTHEKATNA